MRVLVTADTVGGVWTYTHELVSGLIARGFEVVLVSFGNIPSLPQMQWMKGLPGLDYRPTAFKLEWMQDSISDLRRSADYLQSVADETKPDLLHISQYYYGGLRCDAPCLLVAHSDVVSWWVASHGCEPPDSEWIRWYRQIVQDGVTRADAVVTPSRWMLTQIERYYAQPRLASVIYNGRTPSLFDCSRAKEELITTVGRLWDRGKNAALFCQEEMPWPVCVVGADKHPENGAGCFEKQPPQGVRLLPQQSEEQLRELLSRTAIYAAVSRYEPFGLAPVEAALSGCAIVASDIESLRELWGNAAVFFRNNDAASLRQALADLAGDSDFRRSYASRAYDHARRCFAANCMVDQYVSLYKRLVPSKSFTHVPRKSAAELPQVNTSEEISA